MQSKDLRIGNLVNYIEDNEIFIVSTINYKMITAENSIEVCTLDIEAFEPIPITEEWLVNLGFKNLKRENETYYRINDFVYILDYRYVTFGGNIISRQNIDYVHQLQNLYFALYGKELELKSEFKP